MTCLGGNMYRKLKYLYIKSPPYAKPGTFCVHRSATSSQYCRVVIMSLLGYLFSLLHKERFGYKRARCGPHCLLVLYESRFRKRILAKNRRLVAAIITSTSPCVPLLVASG